MIDRHALLRRIYADGWRTLAEHTTRDFEPEGAGAASLRVLFPKLAIEVVDLFDAADDRVVARLRVTLGEDDRSFEMAQVWRFRGDELCGVWSLHDALPWMQALGALPADGEIERRLEEAWATRRPRSPRG